MCGILTATLQGEGERHGFVGKMITGVKETVTEVVAESISKFGNKEDYLIDQMDIAIVEMRSLLHDPNMFVEPGKVDAMKVKWHQIYLDVHNRVQSFRFRLSLRNTKFNQVSSIFLHEFESLEGKIQVHNETVARKRIDEINAVIGAVEGKPLDKQQLLCIAKEAHSHLVLAGAGTGKTTTIVGYIKYLLLAGKCNEDEILVLSFTNASASEMSNRIISETGKKLEACTFHKLGIKIIASVQGRIPGICQLDLRQFARKQLDSLIQQEEYLRKLSYYLTYVGTEQKSEFDFTDEREYQAYLKMNPPITMKKETVKSYGEMDIANFLFQNGIQYIYEMSYPIDTRTSEYGQYHPDFYLPEYGIYIEYFGINRKGEVPAYFKGGHGKSASELYQEGIFWKRRLHQNNGTKLVEFYAYEKMDENLIQSIVSKLTEAGVVFSEKPVCDIWKCISDNSNQTLDRVAELFATVINLIKSNNCTIREIHKRNCSFRNLPSVDTVLDLVEPIFECYQTYLEMNKEIDFNDMVNLASEYVTNGQYQHRYKYVIIDEYQDISQSRFRLLYSMRVQKDYQLFCVGDDWQSIYRFSGSDIGFILNFDKYWGASEVSRIETTYRFPESLIKVSSTFIMNNPQQIKKSLRSAIQDHGFSMERIDGYTEELVLNFLAERLRDLPTGSTVLFLGRYRFDIKILERAKEFEYHYNNSTKNVEVVFSKRRDLRIIYMTIHSSKGLQADYVFLLNNKKYGMGFPSKIADASVLQLLLDNSDSYPYAEERRLFYVAITRAKKKVWLVTIKNNESEFVAEIDSAFGSAMKREQYTCPECGGRLIRRTGKNGDFYGCSNYRSLGCRYTRNIVTKAKTSFRP